MSDPNHRDPDDSDATVRERVDPVLRPGTPVGDYVLGGVLGEGGFGTVYSATHPMIGKRAAIKVLSKDLSADPDMVSRFVMEARAVNTIRHQNIVDIFNIGVLPDGRHYFVMELLDGDSLEDVLAKRVRIDPHELLVIIQGVASALDAAHAKGIVHRDIKPDNIFLHREPNGTMTPKLVDFGVAKLTGLAEGMSHHQTATGTPIGTPRYMSPEQCFAHDIDHRTDIYALGVVCFEALTGEAPFDADSLLVLMNKHTLADRPDASKVCPALGHAFDNALKTMLAIDPLDRPQSAGAALALLEAAVHGRAPAGPTWRHGTPSADTPTNMMALPSAADSGAYARQSTPGDSRASNPQMTALMFDDAVTLATPSQGIPAATQHNLAARKPNTLGATASGIKHNQRGQKRVIWIAAAAALLSLCGVILIVALSGETTAPALPDPAAPTAEETDETAAAPTAPPTLEPTSDPEPPAPSATVSASASASAAPVAAPKPIPRRRQPYVQPEPAPATPKPPKPPNPYDHP